MSSSRHPHQPGWLQLVCHGCFVMAIITSWVWFVLHEVATGKWQQNRPVDSAASTVDAVGVATAALWVLAIIVRTYRFTRERRTT